MTFFILRYKLGYDTSSSPAKQARKREYNDQHSPHLVRKKLIPLSAGKLPLAIGLLVNFQAVFIG